MDGNTKKGIDGSLRQEIAGPPRWEKKYEVCPSVYLRPLTALSDLHNPPGSPAINNHLLSIWFEQNGEESLIPGKNASKIMPCHWVHLLEVWWPRILLSTRHFSVLNAISHMRDENLAPTTPTVANPAEGHSITLFCLPSHVASGEISFAVLAEIHFN